MGFHFVYKYPPPCRRHSCVYNVHTGPCIQSSSFPVLQSSNFQIQFQLESESGVGVWRPILENPFLGGCRGVRCVSRRGFLPPQEEPPAPKFPYLASSWRSCAPSWRQDATTSPKISKKTPSWSQHLPTELPKPSQDSLQDPPEEAPDPKKPAKVI